MICNFLRAVLKIKIKKGSILIAKLNKKPCTGIHGEKELKISQIHECT
jgi:hypothetical protein